ncbi:cytochrome c maturation protein CcmE [Legionella lytica]|uniref:Cytochrome c-type biogenesis protein CcmE n=1 Tax=Legionella lytica TaxID=96232 RepID=A0ABY4Y6T4_9GAMM|nr:cytochrome c maturation protein CcmE [Legionella lytica]USQ13187.1 cytochrome c maturation protein CcmE [Legionella lytica]
MNPARKRKLLILLSSFIALSIAAGLVLYALRQNISLFYTPTQIAEGQAPAKQAIRVGGMVEKGSLVRAKEGLRVEFRVTDLRQTVTVVHIGILPDLFREGQGVVVEGQLIDNQHVQATRVLAKHDEKYMPPEVKAALAPKVNS